MPRGFSGAGAEEIMCSETMVKAALRRSICDILAFVEKCIDVLRAAMLTMWSDVERGERYNLKVSSYPSVSALRPQSLQQHSGIMQAIERS